MPEAKLLRLPEEWEKYREPTLNTPSHAATDSGRP
jgi:hypothetical protein